MSCQPQPKIQTTKRPFIITGNQLIPVGSSNLYKLKNENKKFVTIKTINNNGSIIKPTIRFRAEKSKSNDQTINEGVHNRSLIANRNNITNNTNNNSNINKSNINIKNTNNNNNRNNNNINGNINKININNNNKNNTIKSIIHQTKQNNNKQQQKSTIKSLKRKFNLIFPSPLSASTLQNKALYKHQRPFIKGQPEQRSIIKKNGVINDVKLNNIISNHSILKVPTTTTTTLSLHSSSDIIDHNNQNILNILKKSDRHSSLIPSATQSQSIFSDNLNNSFWSSIDDVKTDTLIDKFDPSNWINNVTNTLEEDLDDHHKYTITNSTNNVLSHQSPSPSATTLSQSPSPSITIKNRKIKSITKVKIPNDKINSNTYAANSHHLIPTKSNTINTGKCTELVNRKSTIPTLNKVKQRLNTKSTQNPPQITNNIKKFADRQNLLNRSIVTKRSYSKLTYHEIIQRIENNRRITANSNKTNNRNVKHSNVISSTSTSSTQSFTSLEYKPEVIDDLTISDNNIDDAEMKHRYLAFKVQQLKNNVNKRRELECYERRRYPMVSVYHKSIMEETRKFELSKYKCLLCSKNVMPLSTYCKLHISCDSNQYLYKKCTGLYPDNSVCNAPILDILSINPEYCPKHIVTSKQTIDTQQKVHTENPQLQSEILNNEDLQLQLGKSANISCILPQEISPTNILLNNNDELLSNTEEQEQIVIEQTHTNPIISETNHNNDVLHLNEYIPDNNSNNSNDNRNPNNNENNSSIQIVSNHIENNNNNNNNNSIEQNINNDCDNENNVIKMKYLNEQVLEENNADVNSNKQMDYPMESSIYQNSESSDDTGIGGFSESENNDEISLNHDKLLEEHDLTNVLNQIPVDAFNEFFTAQSNEKYEPPTLQEHEDLERALRAVDEQVRSLEQMTDDDTTNFLDVDFLEDGILDETEICTDVFETQEIVEIH